MDEEEDSRIPEGRRREEEKKKEKERKKKLKESEEDEVDDGSVMKELEKGREGSLYSILNVPSDAPDDDIRQAYRRLSLIFHPDKHPSSASSASSTSTSSSTTSSPEEEEARRQQSEEEQRAAVEQFQKITRAYEVLSDASQRAIYDLYGEEGLQSKLMQVGSLLTTPAEIKEEFERIQREKEEAILRAQLRPKGTVTATFDASSLFDSYQNHHHHHSGGTQGSRAARSNRSARGTDGEMTGEAGETDSFQQRIRVGLAQAIELAPELRQVTLHQSVETSFTKTDHFSASGFILTRNGMGASELSGTYRHDLSSSSNFEITTMLGSKPGLTLKAFSSSLPFGCFGSVSTSIRADGKDLKMGRSFLIGAPVSDHWVGYINYKSEMDEPGLVVGFNRRHQKSTLRLSTHIGDESTFVTVEGTYDIMQNTKLKANIIVGTPGISVGVGTERQLTEHSKIGFAIEVGDPHGVTIKFRFSHVGQTFSFPVLLAHEPMISAIVFGTAVPLGLGFAANHFIFDPMQKKKQQQRLEKLRKASKRATEEGRKNAQMAIRLMKETVERKREQESSKNGLVIVEALYGLLEAEESRRQGEDTAVIEVTAPLQSLVYNSKLYLTNKSKSNLIGFCDPCVGEEKKLSVKYLFKNRTHFVVINDTDTLALPLKSHLRD